jgi:uncharacterized protein (DUF697 family)
MPRAKLPLAPAAVFALVRELRAEAQGDRPLAVGGPRELAGALRRELERNGEPGAVVESGRFEEVAALVFILAGPPTADDERILRSADRAGAPIVCLAPPDVAATPIPFVLATDVVEILPGAGFPLEELAERIAARLGDAAAPLAARLPFLRAAVVTELTERAARRNGLLGAAIFVPGADLPVLTLNQLRLVLRIAHAYGQPLDAQRVPEILGVVGSGLGFRALARQVLGAVPIAGWAVKGGVAYAGTRALGEAAKVYFDARARPRAGKDVGR